jgi:hypothetical protein
LALASVPVASDALRHALAVALILVAFVLPVGVAIALASSWARFTLATVILGLASVGLMILGILLLGDWVP